MTALLTIDSNEKIQRFLINTAISLQITSENGCPHSTHGCSISKSKGMGSILETTKHL